MSVARFIADQRTMHRVPHAVTCAILGVSVSWFYKWVHREPTPTEVRRSELDAAVKAAFEASKRTYGSPRIHADLVEAGWTVSVNTVADSMRRQGLQGRKPKRSADLIFLPTGDELFLGDAPKRPRDPVRRSRRHRRIRLRRRHFRIKSTGEHCTAIQQHSFAIVEEVVGPGHRVAQCVVAFQAAP